MTLTDNQLFQIITAAGDFDCSACADVGLFKKLIWHAPCVFKFEVEFEAGNAIIGAFESF